MTGREFAEKHAGRRVRLIGHDVPDRSANENPYARVVGYENNDHAYNFLVELEDEHDRSLAWRVPGGITLVVPIESFHQPAVVWTANVDEVQLISRKKNVAKKRPPVKPYPNTCKTCGSPARKACEVVLCSNSHCKSRNKLSVFTKTVKDKFRLIRCPQCRSKAVSCRREYGDNSSQYRAVCLKGHKWDHDIKINDILSKSLSGAYETDRIWSATGWVQY